MSMTSSRSTAPPNSPDFTWRHGEILLWLAALAALTSIVWAPFFAVAAGSCFAGVAIIVRRRGRRRDARAELQGTLLGALAGALSAGGRPAPRQMRVTRWAGGESDHPVVVRLTYDPQIDATSPKWASAVVGAFERITSKEYEISERQPRRCFVIVVCTGDPAERNPHEQRVREIAQNVFSGGVAVRDIKVLDDQVKAFEVGYEMAKHLTTLAAQRSIERTVNALLPGRWRASWDLEHDTARFEVRPTLPDSVWLPTEQIASSSDVLENYRDVKIPYAVDEDGNEVAWYPARVPQAMFTGSTGSGKTSLSHTILGAVTKAGWPVFVIDAKRIEFLEFLDYPNVQAVAGRPEHQVALIHHMKRLMEYRYSLIEQRRAKKESFTPVLLFIDEYAELRDEITRWYAEIKKKGEPAKAPIFNEVASLARKARTARIHLVLTTQRPDAEFLSGEMRDNFGHRVSLGRLSPQGANMMWENPATGVTLPRGKTGRAMATMLEGPPREVQSYRFPGMDASPGTLEHRLLENLRPGESIHPRLVVVPPQELPHFADGTEEPGIYDYMNAELVPAEDRPDLDLLNQEDLTASGIDVSSPTAFLTGSPAQHVLIEGTSSTGPDSDGARSEATANLDELAPEDDGYGDVELLPASDLSIGDMIEHDPDSGLWAVVDAEPEADVTDPGTIALSWRDDNDESGVISVGEDELVSARQPNDTAP